jgi:hypothetical protein
MRYTRRLTLFWLSCASGLSLLPQYARAHAPGLCPDQLAATLRTLVDDHAAARRFGLLYVRQVPAEADPGVLARLILGSTVAGQVDGLAPDRSSLRRRLDAKVRDDFSSGTTVRLDGWVLSRTEARLCALCR